MTFKHVRPAKARTFDKKRDGYLLSAVTPKNTVAEVKRNGWRFAKELLGYRQGYEYVCPEVHP